MIEYALAFFSQRNSAAPAAVVARPESAVAFAMRPD